MDNTAAETSGLEEETKGFADFLFEAVGLGIAYTVTKGFEYPDKIPYLDMFGAVKVAAMTEKVYSTHVDLVTELRKEYLASLPSEKVEPAPGTLMGKLGKLLAKKEKKQPLTSAEIRDRYYSGLTARVEKGELAQYLGVTGSVTKVVRSKTAQTVMKTGLVKILKSRGLEDADYIGDLFSLVFTYINSHPVEIDKLLSDSKAGSLNILDALYERWGPARPATTESSAREE